MPTVDEIAAQLVAQPRRSTEQRAPEHRDARDVADWFWTHQEPTSPGALSRVGRFFTEGVPAAARAFVETQTAPTLAQRLPPAFRRTPIPGVVDLLERALRLPSSVGRAAAELGPEQAKGLTEAAVANLPFLGRAGLERLLPAPLARRLVARGLARTMPPTIDPFISEPPARLAARELARTYELPAPASTLSNLLRAQLVRQRPFFPREAFRARIRPYEELPTILQRAISRPQWETWIQTAKGRRPWLEPPLPTQLEVAERRAGTRVRPEAPSPIVDQWGRPIWPRHPPAPGSEAPPVTPATPIPPAPRPIAPQRVTPPDPKAKATFPDAASVNLNDPKAIARYLVATGRILVQPGLEGEFRAMPFYVKSRSGRKWDEVVQEIADAKSVRYKEVEDKLFMALRGGPMTRTLPVSEVRPPPPEWGIDPGEWAGMKSRDRENLRDFFTMKERAPARASVPLEVPTSPLAERAIDETTKELARRHFAQKQYAPPLVREEVYRVEYQRLQAAAQKPTLPPSFERTETGEQGVIPGVLGREVPKTPIRAERPQADIRGTPLFGQERAAREQAMETAQRTIPAGPMPVPRGTAVAPSASPPLTPLPAGLTWRNTKPPTGMLDRWETMDSRFVADQVTHDHWAVSDRRKGARASTSVPSFHEARQWVAKRVGGVPPPSGPTASGGIMLRPGLYGIVPPVPVPSPPEEERDTTKGRLQQVAQALGLGVPILGMALSRGRMRPPAGTRPPPVLPQFRREVIGSTAAPPPRPTVPSGPPPVPPAGRPSWWRTPEPDVVAGWRIVQRAEGTMNWGRSFGEQVRRRLGAAIPQVYHHPASQYLDTGRPEFLTGLPGPVRAGVQQYRDLTEHYRAMAQTGGLLDDGVEHYFTHIIEGPPRAVAEARRRFANARKTSPYLRERTIPTLDATEAWLQQEGLSEQGVRVARDPSKVARAYVVAYHQAEALRGVSRDLATSLTKAEGRPVLIGAEEGIRPPPAGYVVFEHPLLRSSVGNKLPLLDARYVTPVRALLTPPAEPARFIRALDTVNNLHRGIVMALPWKHGLLNVGMDALMMTGLWRGIARGEWLGTRRAGYRMLRDMDPFVEKLIRLGEVRIPVISAPLEEIRRSLSEMIRGARVPFTARQIPGAGRTADFWEQVERITWERMVGGWAVGLSKLLMDRMAAGQVPHAFQRTGITQELWAGMSEPERFKAVGRTITLMTGQLPRTLFADPNFVAGFRHVMFSPSWNLSNLGMVQALVKAEGTFALRGLTGVERRVVEEYMQEYALRSIATHYGISLLAQAATTAALTGATWYLWQNPPGLRTRIYAGTDPEGRHRYGISPFGYFVKDLENAVYATWRLGHLDPGAAQEFVRHKLALGPRLVAEHVAGLRDPLEPRVRRLGGRELADRITDTLEDLANSFVPLRTIRRDPVGGAAATGGLWFRRAPTTRMLRGQLAAEDREYASAIRGAMRRGDTKSVQTLQARRLRAREEHRESLRKLLEYESLTGSGRR